MTAITKCAYDFNRLIMSTLYIKEGNENMKAGYVLIDCKGLDLLSESTQTIAGLYDRVKAAMATGKMIIAENLIWDDGVDRPISPVPCFGIDMGDYGIYITASTLQIRVSKLDVVTIVNMAPAQEG